MRKWTKLLVPPNKRTVWGGINTVDRKLQKLTMKGPKGFTAAQHSEPALGRGAAPLPICPLPGGATWAASATAAPRGWNSAQAQREQLSAACPKSEPGAGVQQQGSANRPKGTRRHTGLAPVWISLLPINCYLLLPFNSHVPKMRF